MATTVRPSTTAAERPLEVSGSARVEQRGRLVEDQRVRVGEDEPRQGELLRLRLGEPVAAGPDEGVEPLGQLQRPAPRVDGGQRVEQLLARGLGPGQAQVVLERPDEDVVLLRDERDLAAQLGELEVDEAHTADLDASLARTVDAGHEPAQRRLAGTRRPDDGEALAGPQVERDAAQHVAAGPVGVVDVVDLEAVVGRLRSGGGAVGRDVGDADDAGQAGRADLDLVEPGDELVERAGHLLHVERHGGDGAGGRDVARDEEAAPEQGDGHRREEGELHRREPPQAQSQRVELGVVAVAQGVVHAAPATAAETERVDGAAAVGRLGDDTVEHGIRGSLAEVALGGVAQVAAGRQHEDGHTHDDRQGDLPTR